MRKKLLDMSCSALCHTWSGLAHMAQQAETAVLHTSSRHVSPPEGGMSVQALPAGAGAGANTGTAAPGVTGGTGMVVPVGEAVGEAVCEAVLTGLPGEAVATGDPVAAGVTTGDPANMRKQVAHVPPLNVANRSIAGKHVFKP